MPDDLRFVFVRDRRFHVWHVTPSATVKRTYCGRYPYLLAGWSYRSSQRGLDQQTDRVIYCLTCQRLAPQ